MSIELLTSDVHFYLHELSFEHNTLVHFYLYKIEIDCDTFDDTFIISTRCCILVFVNATFYSNNKLLIIHLSLITHLVSSATLSSSFAFNDYVFDMRFATWFWAWITTWFTTWSWPEVTTWFLAWITAWFWAWITTWLWWRTATWLAAFDPLFATFSG